MYFAIMCSIEVAVVLIARRRARTSWAELLRILGQRRHAWRVVYLLGLAAVIAISPLAIDVGPLPFRAIFGISALLLAPGAAFVAFWPIPDLLDELLLSVVLSMAILVLSAMVMLWAQVWNSVALLQILAIVIAPTLSWHAIRTIGSWDRASTDHTQEHITNG